MAALVKQQDFLELWNRASLAFMMSPISFCFSQTNCRLPPVSRTAQLYRWYGRPTSSLLLCHQSSGRTTVQTVFCWQPSFAGCRRQDPERTARQPRLCNILTDFSTPSNDIFVPAILLVALQWT